MMLILLAVHIFFTFRTGFVQLKTLKGVKYSAFPEKPKNGIGTYKAFASALGTTIGPGNITGVAVAISLGGAGSVFWMWLSGILAMATKCAESYLSMKYVKHSNFTQIGGTGVLLEKTGNKRLSAFWTVMCALGGLFMGAAVPSSSLCGVIGAPDWFVGSILALAVVLTVSFGLKGIANVCALLVPIMSAAFIGFCLFLIFRAPSRSFAAVLEILNSAFDFRSALGGTVGACVKHGITRGLYSNESGLGTGGVMAAESGDSNLVLSSLAAMTTVLWDTVVMCALTGVTFVSYGAGFGRSPQSIMDCAFGSVAFGNAFLGISMTLFVFATVIGWYYIAKRALCLVTDKTGAYDPLYIAAVFFGAVLPQSLVWALADTVNLCMLVPSLYVLIKLSGKIVFTERENDVII